MTPRNSCTDLIKSWAYAVAARRIGQWPIMNRAGNKRCNRSNAWFPSKLYWSANALPTRTAVASSLQKSLISKAQPCLVHARASPDVFLASLGLCHSGRSGIGGLCPSAERLRRSSRCAFAALEHSRAMRAKPFHPFVVAEGLCGTMGHAAGPAAAALIAAPNAQTASAASPPQAGVLPATPSTTTTKCSSMQQQQHR